MFALISRVSWSWGCSALLYAMTAWPCMAQSQAAPDDAVVASAAPTPIFGTPVESSLLEGARGGTFQTENQMTLTGTTSNNSAQNVVTGGNSIERGAFDQMTGLPVVIQNSGANVLIQNAVIVNLQMQ